jgi:alkylation response protein AidB-like acyl-CoA dehydrogenase
MNDPVPVRPDAAPLSFKQLMAAAEQLVPLVEAEADEAERLYHQTDRLMSEIRRVGLHLFLTPKVLGGHELNYVDSMRIVERLSWADGSTGWCMMVIGIQAAQLGTFLSDAGVARVFANGPDVIGAGQGVPRGRARPVDGGYMVKGTWGYGSGIHHAEWIHSGCFVMDDDKMKLDRFGKPEIVLVHHPKSEIEVDGNWDVLGLRGTGSYDYAVKGGELFVSSDMCWLLDAEPFRGGIQYTGSIVALSSWGHTGWALGVGRRILDELNKLARTRTDAFGVLANSAGFKQSYAAAESKFRSAHAFVYRAWEDLDETYAQGKRATVEQITLTRMAMRHLHDVLSQVATFAHRTARGASLRPSILQRCYRDIHSGTQHIFLADEILQDCGRVLLGGASKEAEWMILGLRG